MYVGFEEFHPQGRRITCTASSVSSLPSATPYNPCLSHLQHGIPIEIL